MRPILIASSGLLLTLFLGCSGSSDHVIENRLAEDTENPVSVDSAETQFESKDWAVGDTIPFGMADLPSIQILEVHANGSGEVCGTGRSASLKYKAMLADGSVIDPGRRPYTFQVGPGNAIMGWHLIVSKMRVGDSITVLIPERLAYGPSKGDLKFDMELLSVR